MVESDFDGKRFTRIHLIPWMTRLSNQYRLKRLGKKKVLEEFSRQGSICGGKWAFWDLFSDQLDLYSLVFRIKFVLVIWLNYQIEHGTRDSSACVEQGKQCLIRCTIFILLPDLLFLHFLDNKDTTSDSFDNNFYHYVLT